MKKLKNKQPNYWKQIDFDEKPKKINTLLVFKIRKIIYI